MPCTYEPEATGCSIITHELHPNFQLRRNIWCMITYTCSMK